MSQPSFSAGNKRADAIEHCGDRDRHILWLIVIRAVAVQLILNLAHALGILRSAKDLNPIFPLYAALSAALTLLFLAVWWKRLAPGIQLRFQAACDFAFAAFVISQTGRAESIFVFFFLLIIVYCALFLGRIGGMVAASVSSILYAAIIIHGLATEARAVSNPSDVAYLSFLIALHSGSFFAVAYLGAYLSQSLSALQFQLAEKIHSLRELERLSDRIVNSIKNGLITAGLDGAISTFNVAAMEISGLDPASAAGRPVSTILGKEFWSKVCSTDLLQQARALRSESWYETPHGVRRFLGFSVSPLVDENHRPLGYIISFQDLTEIKRLEEEVRVRDRMAAIGRMAAGIAHEIRNPLAAMQGSVELLRQRAQLKASEERLLEILQRESARLNRFVEQFVRFAQPGDYPHKPLDLVPLLQDFSIVMQNDPQVQRMHSVRLHVENPRAPILGHAAQLQQVFWNLSQNAFRAMPGGGGLDISVRRGADGSGEVDFADEGIGMSGEERTTLFQPFHAGFRGGAGLGLSIAFQIMEDHKGRISVESRENRGTRIKLSFPCLPPGTESTQSEVENNVHDSSGG